jgi:hypothetical protein
VINEDANSTSDLGGDFFQRTHAKIAFFRTP